MSSSVLTHHAKPEQAQFNFILRQGSFFPHLRSFERATGSSCGAREKVFIWENQRKYYI